MVGLRQKGLRGWGELSKIPKRGWNRKEGKGKDFKKDGGGEGGKLDQGMGTLKRGPGTP